MTSEMLKNRVAMAEVQNVPILSVRTEDLAELLGEIKRLQELVKSVPFEVGDTVREVGEEEPTGEIIEIKEGPNETAYVVKLNRPFPKFNTVIYYVDEIELIERKTNEA